ncbi:MAG: glycosyltransferase family A protein [Candidatus Woesearchaeota archaeon]
MPEKVLGCVFAYNEYPDFRKIYPLKGVLEALVSSYDSIIQGICLVDDGSGDKTYEIMTSFKEKYPFIELIRHEKNGKPENLGKAMAFLSALIYAAQNKYDILFYTDADMLNLNRTHIETLVNSIRNNPDIEMVRATYNQQGINCPIELSGFRAVRVELLRALYDPSHQNYENAITLFAYERPSDGFLLESFLEYVLNGIEVKIPILQSRRAGGATPAQEINAGISKFQSRVNKR